MKFERLSIKDVIKVTPRIFQDNRGEFMESFKQAEFNEAVGFSVNFVQENQSLSLPIHTVRGLHFQSPPSPQGKLVRCVKGSVIDIVVDVRKGSPDFGKWVGAVLSDTNHAQLWVPEGFLHGFATLKPNTILQYKCTDYYAPKCDGNVYWNDTDLNIDWGFDLHKAVLSKKDLDAQHFKDFESPFDYTES